MTPRSSQSDLRSSKSEPRSSKGDPRSSKNDSFGATLFKSAQLETTRSLPTRSNFVQVNKARDNSITPTRSNFVQVNEARDKLHSEPQLDHATPHSNEL